MGVLLVGNERKTKNDKEDKGMENTGNDVFKVAANTDPNKLAGAIAGSSGTMGARKSTAWGRARSTRR